MFTTIMHLTELIELSKTIKEHKNVQLKCGLVINSKNMIDTHIATLLNYPKNATFKPYYDRLLFVVLNLTQDGK